MEKEIPVFVFIEDSVKIIWLTQEGFRVKEQIIEYSADLPTVCAKCHLPWGDGKQHETCWKVTCEYA